MRTFAGLFYLFLETVQETLQLYSLDMWLQFGGPGKYNLVQKNYFKKRESSSFSLEVEFVTDVDKNSRQGEEEDRRVPFEKRMGKEEFPNKYFLQGNETEKVVNDLAGEESKLYIYVYVYVFMHILHQSINKDVSGIGVPRKLNNLSFIH